MQDNQQNIVPAENQNPENYYEHPGDGLRILFVGNSVTKHAPKPDIGWDRDCGMAASALEKDYVHRVMARVREKDPAASFAVFQVARWERNFMTMNVREEYPSPARYAADLIIFFFGANVSKEYDTTENPAKTFEQACEELREVVTSNPRAKVYISEGFYLRPVLNAEKKKVADRHGDTWIPMSDITAREDVRGLFNHPSDFGMELIANRFYEAIEPELLIRLAERSKSE